MWAFLLNIYVKSNSDLGLHVFSSLSTRLFFTLLREKYTKLRRVTVLVFDNRRTHVTTLVLEKLVYSCTQAFMYLVLLMRTRLLYHEKLIYNTISLLE